MRHIEGTFESVRNLKVYHQAWFPEGEIKAVLFIVHGVGEYSARYTNVINRFVPLGYAVYGVDHIGHGKSEGEREMVSRFEDFIEPLITCRKMIAEAHPGVPVIIYGHSMGALITSFHLLDHQADFKAAIISAPPVKVPANISPLTVTLGKVISTIAPKMGLIGLDVHNLSHDKAVVDSYINDPLVFHGKMPARLSAEMLRAMMRVTAEANKIEIPLFILQGSADHLVDPSGAQMLYEKASSADKTLKIYEGLYHEVHNEPEREMMFKDLEAWLEAHV